MEHVEKPPGMTDWPEFHNGVAAGLKIGLGISKVRVWSGMFLLLIIIIVLCYM